MMNQKTIVRLQDLVSDHFFSSFNVWKSHMIDFAPRASTKTSKNALKIALKMIEYKDMEIVIVRQNAVDHRKSTFLEMITAFRRLGINLKQGINYPRGNTGTLWLRTPWNSYIHFSHLHDLDSLKGIVPSSTDKFIGITWFFEVTQFIEEDYAITQAISSFSRGTKKFYYNLYELNPSPTASDWTYEWVEKMRKRPDCIVIEGTVWDVPEAKRNKWFPELMKEIEILKNIDYSQYAHIYLGELYSTNGKVFKKFNLETHTGLIKNLKISQAFIGVDYGESDATCFELVVLNEGFNGITFLREYYHKNGEGENKDINNFANDLLEFINKSYELVKRPIKVFIDSASNGVSFFNVINKIKHKVHGKATIDLVSKNSTNIIENRISVMNLMLGAPFIKIDKSCTYLIKALDLHEYDKNGKMIDDTHKMFTDALDASFYAWIHLIDKVRQLVLSGRKYKE